MRLAVAGSRGEGPSSLVTSALWLLGGKGLAFALAVALPLVLVRQLSLHDYGLYKQIFLVVGTAVTLLPLGFATTAGYFLPRAPERGPTLVLNIVVLHALVGGLAWGALFFAPGLLGALFHDATLVEYAPLTAWVVLFWVVSSALEPIVVANQEASLAATLIAVRQLAKTVLTLLAAVWMPGLHALLYVAVAHGVADIALLAGYLVRRFGRFWRQFDRGLLRSQLAYALPHGFAVLLWFVQADLHQYVVASRYDPTVYALYAVGCFQLPLTAIMSESVSSVLIPRVSRLQLEGRRREILVLTTQMVTRLAVALVPLYVFLLVTGREFIAAVFTAQYEGSWAVFAVNLSLIPLSLMATACDPVIRGYAEQRYFLIKLRVALSVILALALGAFVAGPWGPVVAVTTVVVAQAAERLIIAFRVARVLQARVSDLHLLRGLARVALAALGAGAGAMLVRQALVGSGPVVILGWCGGAFAVLYGGALALLGGRRGRLGTIVSEFREVKPATSAP